MWAHALPCPPKGASLASTRREAGPGIDFQEREQGDGCKQLGPGGQPTSRRRGDTALGTMRTKRYTWSSIAQARNCGRISASTEVAQPED